MDQLTKNTLENLKVIIECESPLEIRQEQHFASNSFAKIVIQDLLLEATNAVLTKKTDEWHNNTNESSSLHEYLGFSLIEYKDWIKNSSIIPEKLKTSLLIEFNKNPTQFDDYL